MALRFEHKKTVVKEVNQMASEAISAVIAEYRGLTMAEMTELRRKAMEMNVQVRVVRNTLARRAVQETDLACLDPALTGPVVLLFAMEHPGAAARLAKDFSKNHSNLKVTALAFEGNLLPSEQLAMLASLPTYDEAIAQLMSVMQAPLTQAARLMNETVAQLARVTAAVAEQQSAA